MDSKASSSAPGESPIGQAPILAPVADAMKSMEGIKDNVGNVKDKAMNSVYNVMVKATATNSSVMVTSLIIGFAVAAVVGYGLYWMLTRGTLTGKMGFSVNGLKTPVPGYQVLKTSAQGVPSFSDKMSISFWMYVNDIPQIGNSTRNQAIVRHVWHRGNDNPKPNENGPLVSLVSYKTANGPQKNVVAVSMRPKTTTAEGYQPVHVLNAAFKRGVIFDYIPIKRWVQITVVVNLEAKTITGYMDGQLISGTKTIANNVFDELGYTKPVVNISSDEIDLVTSSPFIYVGGRVTSTTGLGFAGLVSNLKFFNYALTTNEVYREYKRGPVDNLLSAMGLPAYGIRPPVYKIGDTE